MSLKQLFCRVLAAAITFTVGVCLYLPWRKSDVHRTSIQEISTRSLSACEALRNPARYRGEMVKLRGAIYGNTDGTLVLNELDCSGDGAWVTVSFDGSLAGEDKARRFIELMRKQSVGETMARAEVVVVGRLTPQGARTGSAPRYRIDAEELEQLTPISIVSFVSN